MNHKILVVYKAVIKLSSSWAYILYLKPNVENYLVLLFGGTNMMPKRAERNDLNKNEIITNKKPRKLMLPGFFYIGTLPNGNWLYYMLRSL